MLLLYFAVVTCQSADRITLQLTATVHYILDSDHHGIMSLGRQVTLLYFWSHYETSHSDLSYTFQHYSLLFVLCLCVHLWLHSKSRVD